MTEEQRQDDYLWDKSGEVDPTVARLESLLSRFAEAPALAHQGCQRVQAARHFVRLKAMGAAELDGPPVHFFGDIEALLVLMHRGKQKTSTRRLGEIIEAIIDRDAALEMVACFVEASKIEQDGAAQLLVLGDGPVALAECLDAQRQGLVEQFQGAWVEAEASIGFGHRLEQIRLRRGLSPQTLDLPRALVEQLDDTQLLAARPFRVSAFEELDEEVRDLFGAGLLYQGLVALGQERGEAADEQ